MKAFKEYEVVIELIKQRLGEWRKFTVAIDGSDHSGKSTIARYIAWKLGISAIETDMCRKPNICPIETDPDILMRLIRSRHIMNRPVIVEGITVLEPLTKLSVEPDVLILMKNTSFDGSRMFHEKYETYKNKYSDLYKPDYILEWNGDEESS